MKSLPSTPTNVDDVNHSFYHLNYFGVVDDKIALVKYSLDSFGVLTNHFSLQLFVELYVNPRIIKKRMKCTINLLPPLRNQGLN